MEYQKITNLLDDTPNQPTKFRAKNWVGINYEERWLYNINSRIKFKASRLRSSLCGYRDACILVSGTTTVAELAEGGLNNGTETVFKNCGPFNSCKREINNT